MRCNALKLLRKLLGAELLTQTLAQFGWIRAIDIDAY